MEKMGKGNKTNLSISVALCTYNGERFIKEQLNSIINQVLPVNEIIICDDCSTDNTINIIEDIVDNNPKIKFHINQNSKNLGVVRNFAKAISLCSGDIIFLSDQDDIWMNNKTNIIINYFKQHPQIELVFSDASLINENNQSFTKYTLFDAVGLKKHIALAFKVGLFWEITNTYGNRITGATVAFRTNIIKRALPFDTCLKSLHDEQLANTAIRNCSIAMINKQLIKYRIHSNNVCGLKKNWIINGFQNPFKLSQIYIPYPCNFTINKITPSDKIYKRIVFNQKRNKYIQTAKGRIKLIISILQYFKYYNIFSPFFLISDLFIGLPQYFKKRFKIK